MSDGDKITAEWCRENGAEWCDRRKAWRWWVGTVDVLWTIDGGVELIGRWSLSHVNTCAKLLALLSALRGEPSGTPGQLPEPLSKPEALPLAAGQQVWIVGRVIFDAWQQNPHRVSPWTFQGVFLTREKAIAACRDGHYFIAPVTIGEPFPHIPSAIPCAEFPAVDAVDLSEMLGKPAAPAESSR